MFSKMMDLRILVACDEKTTNSFLCVLRLRGQEDFEEFAGDGVTVETHDAFLGGAKAEEVDAAVPGDAGVDDGEFLVDSGAFDDGKAMGAKKREQVRDMGLDAGLVVGDGAGHDGDGDA